MPLFGKKVDLAAVGSSDEPIPASALATPKDGARSYNDPAFKAKVTNDRDSLDFADEPQNFGKGGRGGSFQNFKSKVMNRAELAIERASREEIKYQEVHDGDTSYREKWSKPSNEWPGSREFESMVRMSPGDVKNATFSVFGSNGAKLAWGLSTIIYAIGFSALIIYAFHVYLYSPSLGLSHTLLPALLHVIGISSSVLTKIYWDFKHEVGHLESMHVIIRSRMWLFPECFGKYRKLGWSQIEKSQRMANPKPVAANDDDVTYTYELERFLKKCQFPEFSFLFRAFGTLRSTQRIVDFPPSFNPRISTRPYNICG